MSPFEGTVEAMLLTLVNFDRNGSEPEVGSSFADAGSAVASDSAAAAGSLSVAVLDEEPPPPQPAISIAATSAGAPTAR